MSPRLTSLSLASSLVSAIALAGCSEPPARFADASLAQLDRAYTASTGVELLSAVLFGSNLVDSHVNSADPTGCPAVTTAGLDTTVTGGCTDADGARIAGSVRTHNLQPLGGPAADPAQPRSIDLDYHITTRENRRIALVGHVELDSRSASPFDLSASRLQGDLTIDVGGIESTSRLDINCDGAGVCTASPGSEIAISDLGSAGVEGAWRLDESPTGRVILRGEDELVLDIAGQAADGCVPYSLGEQRGKVCRSRFFRPLGVFARVGGQAIADAPPAPPSPQR